VTHPERRARRALSLAAVSALSLGALTFAAPGAEATAASTAYALSGSSLLSFDPAKPTVVTSTAITGVNAGETLVGIDVRPQNGLLYGVGVNASADTATLYDVSPETGFATAVGGTGAVALTVDGSVPVDLPDPASVGYGTDFNPAVDRLRVVAGSLNFRINPNTGTAIDGNAGTTGVNPDGATNGATTNVDGAAYTNNRPNQTVTTLYTLDSTTNSLYVQNPPNVGTQTSGVPVTVGGNTVNFNALTGFDIDDTVDAASSNAPVASGFAYATLNVSGSTGLYKINLVTGAATLVGKVGDGTLPVQGLALQRNSATAGRPVVGLSADGQFVVRFSSNTPGTTTTVATSGITGGESLVGLTWRPATGQLYALGINAVANTGTMYLLDPQTGVLTPVGAPGGIAFTTDGTTAVDFGDPATTGYGMDFNPTVDRIRVVTGDGRNFRLNPSTGAPVDGNGAVGTNPDADLNGLAGGSTGLTATAYTNSYGQPLTGGATTLYGVDPAANELTIITPPNNGVATNRRALTMNGSPLDVANLVAFDLTGEVKVATSNLPATGTAYASFVVGGVPGLYLVDLATAKATSVGTIGAGTTALRSIAVGQAQTPPPVLRTSASLVWVASPKQIGSKIDSGRVLKCPSTFYASSCSVTTRLTVTGGTYQGKLLGKVTAAVARGHSAHVTVTLTSAGRAFVKAHSSFTSTIAITYPGAPDAKSKTVTTTLVLKASKL
jgi:hypothetical protein